MKLIAVATALVVVAVVPASAATSSLPCAVVVDDQRGLVEGNVGDSWRDLRSVTVGSDRRHVTVVLQLAALPAAPSRPEHALVDYTMRFTVGAGTAFLSAPAHEGSSASYGAEVGFRPLVLGEATVVRDRRRQQLRVTAPLAAFAPWVDLTPGGTATNLAGLVTVTPSAPSAPAAARPQTLVVDGLDGKATHRVGTRSCVPVGR